MLAALVVTSCVTITPDATAPANNGYPAPDSAGSNEGYPAPTAPRIAEARPADALPTAASDTVGVVAGTIATDHGEGAAPIEYGLLYIAELIYDENGEPQAAAYTDDAPSATTDEAGNFAFTELPPGEYALFYWTPQGSILLPDLATNKTLIIKVEGGQVVDLGLLVYDF